jgi:outer membrane protein
MKVWKRLITDSIILLPTLLFVSTAVAQHRLTLQESIDLSIKNSKQLLTSQARIEEAVATTRQALDARLPAATASGTYMLMNHPFVDLKLKVSDTNGSASNNGLGSVKISSLMYATLNASLPIFTGGKIRYGIRSAEFLEKAARLDADEDRQTIIQNTIEAYNNLFKAQAAITIVDSSLVEAKRRVLDYTRLMQNGLLARNDFLNAQLRESNTEAALLDAEDNLRLAMVNMNIMLGFPDSTQLFINVADMKPVVESRTIADFLQLAMTNRRDVQAFNYRRQAADAGVSAARADALPSIAITGGYNALQVPNAITLFNAMSVGAGLRYDISNIWKRGGVDLAKARVKEAEAGQAQLADAIHLQVVQAYNNYISNQKKIDVYAKALDQAEENFKVLTNKFNNGLATVTEVLDADIARLQARLNESFAVSDTYVAYNKLLQSAGLLDSKIQPK